MQWESNNYYVYLCRCVWGEEIGDDAGVGEGASACACARVTLIIQCATGRHVVICDCGSTIFYSHYYITEVIFGKKV